MPNKLYYGDNLRVLRDSIADASVGVMHKAIQAGAATLSF